MPMLGRCGLVSNYEQNGEYEYRLRYSDGRYANGKVYATIGHARSGRAHLGSPTKAVIERRTVTRGEWEVVG